MPKERRHTTAALIYPRNGAYLITFPITDLIEDAEASADLTDCARSLYVAKRVARNGAKSFGYSGLRWEEVETTGDGPTALKLEAWYEVES